MKWGIGMSGWVVWARQWKKQGEFMRTLRLHALNRHVQRVFTAKAIARREEISALIRIARVFIVAVAAPASGQQPPPLAISIAHQHADALVVNADAFYSRAVD